jgi:ubiquinone biosynthesis protein UbiJ
MPLEFVEQIAELKIKVSALELRVEQLEQKK